MTQARHKLLLFTLAQLGVGVKNKLNKNKNYDKKIITDNPSNAQINNGLNASYYLKCHGE